VSTHQNRYHHRSRRLCRHPRVRGPADGPAGKRLPSNRRPPSIMNRLLPPPQRVSLTSYSFTSSPGPPSGPPLCAAHASPLGRAHACHSCFGRAGRKTSYRIRSSCSDGKHRPPRVAGSHRQPPAPVTLPAGIGRQGRTPTRRKTGSTDKEGLAFRRRNGSPRNPSVSNATQPQQHKKRHQRQNFFLRQRNVSPPPLPLGATLSLQTWRCSPAPDFVRPGPTLSSRPW